ncbi:MAG: hypothetical protein ABIK09_06325 [Pseudomonadota bacterium]
MKRIRMGFVLVTGLAIAACSGGGGGGSSLDTGGGADTGGGDGVAADSAGGDLGAGDTVLLSDTVPPPEDGVTPPEGVSAAWLEDACAGWCSVQDACGDGILDLEACAEDCAAAAGDSEHLAKVACIALGWEGDEVNCDVIQLCEDPLDPEACAVFCGTVADCGLLGEQTAEFFGTTEVECALMCGGFATLTPGGQFDAALNCLMPLAEACDLVGMMGCLGEAGACDSLCGPEGPTSECGIVPEHWAGEGACFDTCKAWDPGPALAVQVCIENLIPDPEDEGPFGNQGECGPLATDRCLDPPATLAVGALEFCENISTLCGEVGPFPGGLSSDVCGWFVTGFLMSAPPGLFHGDFSAAAACVAVLETCDEKGVSWLICFLNVYPAAQDTCELLTQCQEEVQLPPGEGFDQDMCLFYLSVLHVQEPAKLEAALACIDAAEGCQAVFGCLGGGDR